MIEEAVLGEIIYFNPDKLALLPTIDLKIFNLVATNQLLFLRLQPTDILTILYVFYKYKEIGGSGYKSTSQISTKTFLT
jgi:hypothetical protein